jgi:arginase
MERITIVGFPFYTLAKFHGMGLAVKSLRGRGITKTIKKVAYVFNDLGDASLSQTEADSGSPKAKNFQQFLADTDRVTNLANKVQSDDFVFCIGGECSLIVGTMASLKNKFRGKPGVLWIDAHGDFNTPETTQSGFLGGMPLALACGRGPRLTESVESARPLLEEENVAHFASRSIDPLESKAMLSSPMKLYSASSVKKEGILNTATQAADYLADHCDWITCHLDVDSLDPSVMPAVNFPEPNGLTFKEMRTVIATLRNTEKLKVFNLTAYNPLLDQNGAAADNLLEFVSEIFL